MGKRCSVPSSPLHSKHARCPQHKDRSSVAVALHPAPTLADLRKTSESLSRWVQTINHAGLRTRPSRGSNQRRRTPRLTGHRRVSPEFCAGPSAQRALSLGGHLVVWRSAPRRGASRAKARPGVQQPVLPGTRRFSSATCLAPTPCAPGCCRDLVPEPGMPCGGRGSRIAKPCQDLSGIRDTPARRHADSPR